MVFLSPKFLSGLYVPTRVINFTCPLGVMPPKHVMLSKWVGKKMLTGVGTEQCVHDGALRDVTPGFKDIDNYISRKNILVKN